MSRKIIVTGGSGFIGSNFILQQIRSTENNIINLDKLTYAGNPETLAHLENHERYEFVLGDITDKNLIRETFRRFQPDAVVHFAAESHVDRSIDAADDFIQTNIVGTFTLLQESLGYYRELEEGRKNDFRFVHVSTDEVFGSLGPDGYFTEVTAYDPRSPYSASKAASDHLVRAWYHTYGLPVLLTNCSNNYGPYQFPEKLIPLMIIKCLDEQPLPVYGKGDNVRDWIYVDDHCSAVYTVLKTGKTGETYVIGGKSEKKNIEVVTTICDILDEIKPRTGGGTYRDLITYVEDRPGHDQRYAIDPAKISQELEWTPAENFTDGIRLTVQWYLEHQKWWKNIQENKYQQQRLGVI